MYQIRGIDPFLSTGIIDENIRSTSFEGHAKLLTPHRCVDRRRTGAKCLNRGHVVHISPKPNPRWNRRLPISTRSGFHCTGGRRNSYAERPSTDMMVHAITKMLSVRPTEPHFTTASENFISYDLLTAARYSYWISFQARTSALIDCHVSHIPATIIGR